MPSPNLMALKLLQKAKCVELTFDNHETFKLSCEYLRIFSPSAEGKGSDRIEAKLTSSKAQVNITDIQAVGHYAVRLIFDDGHCTGIYSWDTLYELAINWEKYLLDSSV